MSNHFGLNSYFTLKPSEVRLVLNSLQNTLKDNVSNSDQYWLQAYSAVVGSGSKMRSAAHVIDYLVTIVAIDNKIPWLLYDTISEIIKPLPSALKETISQSIRIDTVRKGERLKITSDGRWQVSWQVEDIINPEVALHWYTPPYRDSAPIVPIAIIDCIASCVLLLQAYLVLPAATILSIALEAALWEALINSGISRMSERITYTTVKWRLKRIHDKLLIVAIEGADKSIKELNSSDGSPFMIDLELRKMQASDSAQSVGLRLDVDKNLVGFLASDQEEKREQIVDKGLSVAMQRARHEDIKCLQTVPEFLDDTLIALRNNLVHLPSQDKLVQPIPTPDKNQLQTIDELRSNSELVRHLLYYVVNIINTVFVDHLQLEGA